MHTYAQTNIELFNQLRTEEYSKSERQLAFVAYEFAMQLFTGLFLPSGKTFIDHLVGTASILASLRMPIEVVAAGLIHAAYQHGDFGHAAEGITEAKRQRVGGEVGTQVEDYVARYERLVWSPDRVLVVRDQLDQLGPVERNVVLMRLANELEHVLDLAALYFPDVRQQKGHQKFIERHGPIVVEIAERLGAVSLSAELAAAFREIASAKLPLEPCVRTEERAAYLVAARSYRVRLRIRAVRQAYRVFARSLQGARRVYWKIPEPISGWLRTAVTLSGIKVK